MRIDADLLRKKAEHNEGMLSNLEEIALHQLELEKIENFDKLCRHIKILLLQNNLIEKMENLSKLKELTYLNLALNNISMIEGIESSENLEKLDLTCNFIECKSLLESLYNLKKCGSIRELYLIGNPCTDFERYRELVVAVVDQLVSLDGKEILPSERIQAKQVYDELVDVLEAKIKEIEEQDKGKTEEERKNAYTKEKRKEMYKETKKEEKTEKTEKTEEPAKKTSSMYLKNGEMRQCNEGKYDYQINEYEDPQYSTFVIRLPRFMDTSLIDVDIFPNFVSIRVKDKLTQIKLWEEVFTTPDKLQRSKTTGELSIRLKKVKYDVLLERQIQNKKTDKTKKQNPENSTKNPTRENSDDDVPELE